MGWRWKASKTTTVFLGLTKPVVNRKGRTYRFSDVRNDSRPYDIGPQPHFSMDVGTRYIVGLFVAAHGFVYFATPLTDLSQNTFQGWTGSSLVLGTTLTSDALKSVTAWLWILAGIGLVAAAATIIFTSVLPGVWRPLAVGASVAGVASFVVFYDGQAQQFVNEGGVGLIISLVIAASALKFSHAFPEHQT